MALNINKWRPWKVHLGSFRW